MFKDNQPAYKLRKLTIGLCSVALMAIFVGHTNVVHADEVQDNSTTQEDQNNDAEQQVQDKSSINFVDKNSDQDQQNTKDDTEISNKVANTITNLATTDDSDTVSDSDIDALALSDNDKTTAKNKLKTATADEKTKIAQSIKALKGYDSLQDNNGTFAIGKYNKDKGGVDAILPTVGDFTNLGLNANKVTISHQDFYDLGHTEGLNSVTTSNAGGKISCSDDSLANVFADGLNIYGDAADIPEIKITKIDLQNFDTSNVTSMNKMFDDCSTLTSLNVSNFDTSNVTDMFGMFSGCSSLTLLDISHFDTRNVTDMDDMFGHCSSLTSLDVSHFDTSKATNMSRMFSECSTLKSLDVSNFDTSKVTKMNSMFWGCSLLTSLNVSNFDTSNVTDMSTMFNYCSKLTSLDVSHFNTSKVTSMGVMFGNCESLASLNVSNFDTSKVTDMNSMFWGCSSLTSLDVSHFDTRNVTDMDGMFYGCSSLTSLDVSHFDTSKVTDISGMFWICSSLTNLDVSHFDTSNVTNMEDMFSGCSKLTSLDVSHFNTSNVTKLGYMFSDCRLLTSLDVSNFDTSKVTDMSYMFGDCSSLASLDVSNFDTSKVTDTSGMFWYCSLLTSLDVSNFDTSKVTDMLDMFSGVTLNYLDLTKFLKTIQLTDDPKSINDLALTDANVNYILVEDPKIDTDKVEKIGYVQVQPAYTIDGRNKKTVSVPTIITKDTWNNIKDDTSGYIKNYVDKAFDHDKYSYDNAPELFTLNTVVNLIKNFTAQDKTVAQGTALNGVDLVNDKGDFTNFDLTGYDENVPGKQTVTVNGTDEKGNKFSRTVNVTVLKDFTTQGKTVTQGTSLTAEDLIGDKGDYKNFTIDGYDPNKSGKQTVTVTGDDGNGNKKSETVDVTVLKDFATQDKTVVKGTELSGKDLVSDQGDYTIFTISGYDPNKTGEQEVTVTGKDDQGHTVTKNAKVIVLKDFATQGKTVPEGTKLSGGDLVSDKGDYKTFTIDGYDPNKSGKQTVTITGDDGNGNKKSETVEVTVLKDFTTQDKTVPEGTKLSGDDLVSDKGNYKTFTIDGYDQNKSGKQTVTITGDDGNGNKKSETVEVTVLKDFTTQDKTVPEGTKLSGDDLVSDKGNYKTFTIDGYDPNKSVKQTVTVTGDDGNGNKKSETVEVTVLKDFATQGKTVTQGTKLSGDDLVSDKGDYKTFTIDGYDPNKSGKQTVTVTGDDGNGNKKSETVDFTVLKDFAPQGKTVPEGTKLTGEDLIGDKGDYKTFTIDGYDPNKSGKQTVTITGDDGNGNKKSETVEVTVLKDFTPQGKTVTQGTKLSGDDLVTDKGDYKTFTIDGYDPNKSGKQTVTITGDDGNGNKKSETVGVTVLKDFSVKYETVSEGTKLTGTDLVSDKGDYTEFTLSNYDPTKLGEQTVTVIGKDRSGVELKETDTVDVISVDKEVTFEDGHVPSADSLVHGLPDGKHATWVKEPTAEDPNGVIKVDGRDTKYPVTAKIYKLGPALTATEADLYQIDAKDKYSTDEGTDITAKDLVNNMSDFPGDATWTISGYDKNKVGDQKVEITVTFGDGSKLTAETMVTVNKKAVQPSTPVQPAQPVQPVQPTAPAETKPAKADDTTKKVAKQATNPVATHHKAKVSTKKVTQKVAHRTAKQLPQTGENNALLMLGGLLSTIGLVGASKKRKN
ncbi:MAG: BspA family leucine-rich repeat surface protein [Lactobacillus sp.]|nr:BspA family leucine-rich repeat surface protein [Lactobacillus sp.]